jgi:hypothetical protein
MHLDRDAALLLEVHRVEMLVGHLALSDGAGVFEQAVGERGLAVVDVRDDAEIAGERAGIRFRRSRRQIRRS